MCVYHHKNGERDLQTALSIQSETGIWGTTKPSGRKALQTADPNFLTNSPCNPPPSRQCCLKPLEVLGRSSIDISQTSFSETPAHSINPLSYSNTSPRPMALLSTMSLGRYVKGNAVWTKNPLRARMALLPTILGRRHHYSIWKMRKDEDDRAFAKSHSAELSVKMRSNHNLQAHSLIPHYLSKMILCNSPIFQGKWWLGGLAIFVFLNKFRISNSILLMPETDPTGTR